jgi:hypothetical protein
MHDGCGEMDSKSKKLEQIRKKEKKGFMLRNRRVFFLGIYRNLMFSWWKRESGIR